MKPNPSFADTGTPLGVAIQHQSIALIDTDFHHPETLTFNRFDPALGTLNAIIITCDTRMILTGAVKNNSSDDQQFTVKAVVEMAVTTPPGLPQAALNTAPSVAATFSLPPGGSANIPWNAGIDQRSVLLTTSADLALFTGTGRWRLRASTVTTHAIQGGGGSIESTIRAKAAFDVMVQYEFAPALSPTASPDSAGFHPAQTSVLESKGADRERFKSSARYS